MNILVLLLAMVAPLLLIPLETLFVSPHIFEELAKTVLVNLLIRDEGRKAPPQWLTVIGIGALFSLSETILYLNNFYLLGSSTDFLSRLLLTGGLHITTSLLLYASWRRGWVLGVVGFLLSVGAHYFFNFQLGLRI